MEWDRRRMIAPRSWRVRHAATSAAAPRLKNDRRSTKVSGDSARILLLRVGPHPNARYAAARRRPLALPRLRRGLASSVELSPSSNRPEAGLARGGGGLRANKVMQTECR